MSRRTIKSESRRPKAEEKAASRNPKLSTLPPPRQRGERERFGLAVPSEDRLPKVPSPRSARWPLRISGFGLLSAFGLRPSDFTRLALLSWAFLLGASILTGRAKDFPSITLQEAHETALRYHPQISVAGSQNLVARQVTRQVQAGFWPNLSANVIAVGTASDNTRLAAIRPA